MIQLAKWMIVDWKVIFDSRKNSEFLFMSVQTNPGAKPATPPTATRGYFPRGKRTWAWSWLLPSSNTDVMNFRSYTSTSQYAFIAWCFIMNRAMKAYWEADLEIHEFLTSTLKGEWSAWRFGRFSPSERAPGIHSTVGWMRPTVGLEILEKRKKSPVTAGNRTTIPLSSNP